MAVSSQLLFSGGIFLCNSIYGKLALPPFDKSLSNRPQSIGLRITPTKPPKHAFHATYPQHLEDHFTPSRGGTLPNSDKSPAVLLKVI